MKSGRAGVERKTGRKGRGSPNLPVITLLTDFGTADYFVGAVKGAILSVNPQAVIADITHEIPPQDIEAAAFTFLATYQDISRRDDSRCGCRSGSGFSAQADHCESRWAILCWTRQRHLHLHLRSGVVASSRPHNIRQILSTFAEHDFSWSRHLRACRCGTFEWCRAGRSWIVD